MTDTRTKILAYGFLILAQMMVGINLVGMKYLSAHVPTAVILSIRFSIGSLYILCLYLISNPNLKKAFAPLKQLNLKDWLFIIGEALGAGVLFNGIMLLGLHHTDASIAGVITSALPAIMIILARIVLGDKFTPKRTLCVGFACVGLVIINFGQMGSASIHGTMFGNLLVLIALLPEAAYYILSKAHENKLPIFLLVFLVNIINVVVLLPLMLIFYRHSLSNIHTEQWLVLFVLGLAAGLFFIFWMLGSKHHCSTSSSLSTAFMPIMTILIAWLTLGETVNWIETLGMGFVIASIIFYAKRRRYRKKQPPKIK